MTQQEFLSRRQTLLAQMQPGSAALIFAAPEAVRSADSEYPYRQNSDFWYFTGFNEPEALLVLIKSDETHNHSVLFNRVRDLTAEIWFGRRLGQEAAPAKLGVDRALAFSEINQQLYQLLNGLDAIYFAQGEYAYADEIVFNALEKLRKGSRQNLQAPNSVIDWRPIVHEMRLFKSAEELAVMRRAGEITALAHTRAMEKCRPGMFEYQLEGEILHEFNRHGARFPSYNTIVGGGENGFDLLFNETDPEAFWYCIDTHWMQSGGKNPAEYILKAKGRVPIVHFKDYKIVGGADPIEQVCKAFGEVGEGNLDWPKIIEACRATEVRACIVEQDICPRDPFDCLKTSFDNMVKFGL